jgi:hypothetical protein
MFVLDFDFARIPLVSLGVSTGWRSTIQKARIPERFGASFWDDEEEIEPEDEGGRRSEQPR